MGHQKGSSVKLLIGFQDDISTLAEDGFVLFFNTSGLKSSKNQTTPATLRGNLNPVAPFDGNENVAGQIVVPIDSIAFWYLLKAAFGSPVTTGADPYEHEFKAGNTRSYLTLETQYTDLGTSKYFQYKGCKINGVSFTAGEDGELTASFDVIGSTRTIAGSSFDGSATTLSFSRLKNNQLTMKEGGDTISNAKLVDMNINFNCDTSQFVIGGGGILGSIPDGVMSVSGNLNTLFEDTTLLDKAANSTESSLELTFSASASSKLVISLPEIQYVQNDPGVDGPQGLAVSLPFAAYYDDDAEATSVVATLTNSEEHA